jgi:hypothetical protein
MYIAEVLLRKSKHFLANLLLCRRKCVGPPGAGLRSSAGRRREAQHMSAMGRLALPISATGDPAAGAPERQHALGGERLGRGGGGPRRLGQGDGGAWGFTHGGLRQESEGPGGRGHLGHGHGRSTAGPGRGGRTVTGDGRTTAHRRSGGCRGCGAAEERSAAAAGTARCGTQCAVDAEQIDGPVGGEQGGVRVDAAAKAAGGRPGGCVHGVTHSSGRWRPARLPKSSGPVVTWGTPPRCEGCRSASQGLSLTLMTDLGRSQSS